MIELAADTGSEYVLAVSRCNLGWALVHLDDESAEAQFLLSLEHAPSYGPRETAECLSGLAAVAARDGPSTRRGSSVSPTRSSEGGHRARAVRARGERADGGVLPRDAGRRGEFERLRSEGAGMELAPTLEGLLTP